MGKRISETAWLFFKKQYPDITKIFIKIDILVDKQNVFPKNTIKIKLKTNIERFGGELGPIIDWLDENINDQYYVKVNQFVSGLRYTTISFYFQNEYDAMAFKLVFGDKT